MPRRGLGLVAVVDVTGISRVPGGFLVVGSMTVFFIVNRTYGVRFRRVAL